MTEPSIPKKRTTFWIEPNTHKTFKQICHRENTSMSKKVEAWIIRYVQLHANGNPQLMMESFLPDSGKPSPVRVICAWLDGALSSGEVHCRKKGMWIKGIECYSCKYNRLRKK